MTEEIKILSMNVRGLFSNKKKRIDVFNWSRDKNYDILCFQETHCTKDIEKDWEDEWGFKIVFSHCNSKSAGVCILFKKDIDVDIHEQLCDSNGILCWIYLLKAKG